MSKSTFEHSFAPAPPAATFPFCPLLTVVLWLGCSLIAIFGDIAPKLPVPAPKAEASPPPVLLRVNLIKDAPRVTAVAAAPASAVAKTVPPAASAPVPALPVPRPFDAASMLPVVPALAPLAPVDRVPATAALLPLPPPVAVVAATGGDAAAGTVGAADAIAGTGAIGGAGVSGLVVERLVFGQGIADGQPAPEYPLAAQRRAQTGVVAVRFDVDEGGRVLAADAVRPCRHELLNASAVTTIRRFWRFPAGPRRCYEVEIRFELQEF